MEIKINKEIRDYQESIFFGLSLRQCAFSLLAAGATVGLFFGLRDTVPQSVLGWVCILGAAPFAALGFLKYHGMPAEQLFLAIIRSELFMPERLISEPENIYADSLLPIFKQKQKEKRQ